MKNVSVLNLMTSKYMGDVSIGKKTMIFGQLVTVASLFAQFHAGTKKFLQHFWPPLLKQSIKFVLITRMT